MSVSVRTSGLEALKRRLNGLTTIARGEVAVAMQGAAEAIVAEARHGLGSGGHSRPVQQPADPSGALSASLSVTADPDAGRVSIVAASPYARFLEYGTRRMAARPFLRPAVDATAQQARDDISAAFARAAVALTGDDP